MKVLVDDGFATGLGTGIGRYTENVVHQLQHSVKLELVECSSRALIQRIPSASVRRVFYGIWLETGLQGLLRRLKPDVVHFTNYLMPRARKTQAKYVVTIHDLSAYRYPGTLPRMYAWYLRSAISRAVKMADLVLTPSESVRAEVIDLFGLAGERIRTAYNGVTPFPSLSGEELVSSAGHLRQKYGVREPFLLFVGTLDKRKNITTLIKAFARLNPIRDLQLVLVGKPGFGFSEILGCIQRQLSRERCVVAGFVPDYELAVLYQLADLFVYPTLYEGFGIPLVEAMGFGLPIVASRIASTEEVAGSAAYYYEDPLDDSALAEKIRELLARPQLKEELARRGITRAADFTWGKVGKQYLDAYMAALETR